MKKLCTVVASAALFCSSAAFAGGVAEPIMEPEVIVEEASASSGGYLLPLLVLAILVALIADSGSDAPSIPD